MKPRCLIHYSIPNYRNEYNPDFDTQPMDTGERGYAPMDFDTSGDESLMITESLYDEMSEPFDR